MNYKYFLTTLLALCMHIAGVTAQNVNRFYIPNLTAVAGEGRTVAIPFYMENTSEVVAVQFTLEVPEGCTLDVESAQLTNRKSDHSVTVRQQQEGQYLCLLYSPTNKALLGRSGELFSVNMYVNSDFGEGTTHEFQLEDVVLSMRDGSNCLTSAESGVMTMQQGPDLYVSQITTDASTYAPQQQATISWQVQNIGGRNTEDGWTEYISLKNADGTSTLLASMNYDDILAMGGSVSRQTTISLPKALAMDGEVQFEVEVRPTSLTGESQGLRRNNTASSANVQLSKLLFLEYPTYSISETYNQPLRCTLTRSGNRTEAETFAIQHTADSRITMPEEVTIGAGQSAVSFYLQLTDNDVLDNQSVINLSAEGNGYAAVAGQITIEDNEYPDLEVTASQTDINEGETFQLTITTNHPSDSPITVRLACENAGRFTFPSQATIPANESSVTVDVTAKEDDLPSLELTTAFTANAAAHNRGEAIVILHDDDLPILELQLTPTIVQESIGIAAVTGVLRRTTNTNSKITVKLTDNADGGLYFNNRTLELSNGVEEIHFNLGPIDNALVDGNRTYTITAAVWLSSCSCGASGESAGYVEAQLQVLDDDGPALALQSSVSTMKEGEKASLIVSRNTSITEDLTITLNSDYEEGLTYNQTVTIPAGQQSVMLEVSSVTNNIQGDSHTVIFTAKAEGYATGSCYLIVTDQTLPDMTIKSIDVSTEKIYTGDDYEVIITFTNVGLAEIPARSTYTFVVEGETMTMTLANPIQPMEEAEIKLNLTAPSIPGRYDISVDCNPNHAFAETNTYNNALSTTILVAPPYTYTVTTDRSNYQIGDKVIITGDLSALKGNNKNVSIEPYIICHGERIAMNAVTDDSGKFTAEYTLLSGMSGDLSIGVCMPGENSSEAFTSIHVYGLARSTASYIKSYLVIGTPREIKVPIKNLSSLPLHNIKATVIDNGGHYQVTATDVTLLDGNAETEMIFTLRSDEVSTSGTWERVKINLSSDEGASTDFVLYNYTNTPQARLITDKNVISTNISNQKQTTIPLILTNNGLGETGHITISIPDNQTFLSLTTPKEIASLAYGDSTIVGLCFNPEGLDVNVIQRGSIAINCENADGQIISYNLKVVSENYGSLLVRVEDENTIYGNANGEHPYVSGAVVTLKDYNTGNALFSETTLAEGNVLFDNVPEGYYTLYVTASKHDSYTQNVFVSPGKTTEHLATISYQAISISWNVEETMVADRYEITSELDYETNVPVPVIELYTPDTLDLHGVEDGEHLLYHVTVLNKGLITANNVCIELPNLEGVVFTPLDEYAGFDLAPQQSRSIPVLVTKDTHQEQANVKEDGENRMRRNGNKSTKMKCHDYTYANWEWVCVSDRTAWIGNIGYFLMRVCDAEPTTPDNQMPKDSKPENKPTEMPTPKDDYGEPQVRYVSHPVSQVDLYTAYEIASTISCSLACAFPSNLEEIQKPDIKGILECVLDELVNRHNSPKRFKNSKTESQNSLREHYLDCLDIYLNMGRTICGYYAELANAPQLAADNEMFNKLMPSMDDILNLMNQLHEDDILYSTGVDAIYTSALAMMPQRSADWYDFNLRTFIERQMNTFRMRDNMSPDGTNYCDPNVLDEFKTKIADYEQQINSMGYVDFSDMVQNMNHIANDINTGTKNVCASVKLQIKQEMAFTRQAFRGTLVIENSLPNELTNISAQITATDENGLTATQQEMQIILENVEGFTQSSNGTYSLGGSDTGTFTYLFIPTKQAAPLHDTVYQFGGTLTFDDGSGVMTRNLYPVSLTVKPSPELNLTYFMQRDIYGDDPLTEEVEPMEPAEFSLLINNIGYGDATNVKMVTQQPEIIDNEKGLAIDFELISSQVNGDEMALSFGNSIANDFGTIPAHSQAYAQWWLQSSLLGHFTDYDVEATHVTSYGNPDLSLLNNVTIHELIRSIKVDNGEVTGFVANDLTDAEDTPDIVYFSDGTTADVCMAANTTVEEQSNTEYLLTVTPSQQGWNYGHVTDPTYGHAKLIGIHRQSDGQEINIRNFWQTDRTLRDGKDWLYENNLHFVDNFTNSAETYVLTFEPRPDVELEVASFDGVPEEGTVLTEPLQTVTVTFNKPINAETFTRDDITLNCQGVRVETPITITAISSTQFTLDISKATAENGYYVLTVQTAEITDEEGFVGSVGKSTSWIQYVKPVSLALSFYEAEVTYGNSFAEPQIITDSQGEVTYSSENPQVATVDATSGDVSIHAVGTATIRVNLAETPYTSAASTSYTLTVLQPEGQDEATPGSPQMVSITIPDGKTMATYCSPYPLDFSSATMDCRAFIASMVNGDIIEFNEIHEAKGGVGMLLYGVPGTYEFPVKSCTEEPYNLFVGTLVPTYVERETDGRTNLGLKGTTFVPINAGVIKANKAYLSTEIEAGVKELKMAFNLWDGVRQVVFLSAEDDDWYTISGQHITKPTKRGLYIHGGKKVVIK